MDTKRHLIINKYFAFAFVVFAVLSGVSDNYKEANSAGTRDGRFSYFLNINHLLINGSGRISAQAFENKFNAFHDYLQGILNKDADGSNYNTAAFGVLFFAAIFLNNKILQNNIWRKAVF